MTENLSNQLVSSMSKGWNPVSRGGETSSNGNPWDIQGAQPSTQPYGRDSPQGAVASKDSLATVRTDLRIDPCANTNHLVAELKKQVSELQQKISQLESQLTALTNQHNRHVHEYAAPSFGFITKTNFNNIGDDSLIPFISQAKVGNGKNPNTSTPK